jgi:hypothetical protein
MGSRGSIMDLFLIPIVIFILAITVFTVYPMANQAAESVQSLPNVDPADTEIIRESVLIWDYLIPLITVALFVIVAILAFLIQSPAPFAVIASILWIFQLFEAAAISHAYSIATVNTTLNNSLVYFPLTATMMDNLLFIQFGFGIFILILLYAKIQAPAPQA